MTSKKHLEELWRDTSDRFLASAADRLAEYSEEEVEVINAELRRRAGPRERSSGWLPAVKLGVVLAPTWIPGSFMARSCFDPNKTEGQEIGPP